MRIFYVGTLVLAIAAGASAQTTDTGFQGQLNAGPGASLDSVMQLRDGRLLIGGFFTQVNGQPHVNLARLMADGSLDPTFVGTVDSSVVAMRELPDGRLLIGGAFTSVNGQSQCCLARLNANGTLDASFAPTFDAMVTSIVVQPDGQILVGGFFSQVNGQPREHIVRLHPDGTLDPDFHPVLGPSYTGVETMALQRDGQVLVGGDFESVNGQPQRYLARLRGDGSFDASFRPTIQTNNGTVRAIVVQPDGHLMVGGFFTQINSQSRPWLARIGPDGTLDAPTAAPDSPVLNLTAQPDGRILVGGFFDEINGVPHNNLARVFRDGSFDPGFIAATDAAVFAVAVQGDGQVLFGGSFSNVNGQPRNHFARVYADGALERGFVADASGQITMLATQPDGAAIVGGTYAQINGVTRHSIARLRTNGTVDTAFIDPDDGVEVFGAAVAQDGSVMVTGDFTSVAGHSTQGYARFLANGTFDPAFTIPAFNNIIYGVAPLDDGRTVIGGSFSDALLVSPPQDRFAMLHGDGSFDNSFASDVWSTVHALLVQPDDHIILGGSFPFVGNEPRSRLARVSPVGDVDLDFVPPTLNGDVRTMMRQPDGKLLVTGPFTQVGVTAQAFLTRLLSDGSLDPDFHVTVDAAVHAIALQADGRIIIGGDFSDVNGATRSHLARLLADGSVDPDFIADVDSWGSVNALAFAPDGTLWVGGYFATIAGEAHDNFARLRLADAATVQRFELADHSTVTWERGGATAEFARVSIEQSLDGTTWTDLGAALRVTGGWSLGGLALPRNQNVWLRGSGVAYHGRYNAGSRVNAVRLVYLATHDVTPSAGPHGALSQTLAQSVDEGETIALTVIADAGYHTDTVTGCGGTLAGSTFTTAPVFAACTVTATFAINTYTVTSTAGAHGTIAPAGTQTVDHGDARGFTVAPAIGYHIDTVTGCGGALNGATFTTAPVTAACTVTATFAINTYTVTSAAGPHGTIAPAGTQSVDHGDTRAFTVAAATGYHIATVTGCGGTLNGAAFTTAPVVAACTVVASFAADPPPPDPPPTDPAPPNPTPASYTRYFAEGASNDFFATRLAVMNPNDDAATVLVRLFGANGQETTIPRVVPARTRTTFELNAAAGLPDAIFSSSVESNRPIVADRLMTWDATGYGSSLETGGEAPGTTWYLAEGATGGSFSLFYLLLNPGAMDATATVTYLLPEPSPPIVKTYRVPAHSRLTVDVTGEDPALNSAEVAAKITSDQPIFVERAMYRHAPGQVCAAGHDGAGIPAPATRWFVAEGATGFFDEYVLIANGEANAADLTITYLIEGAEPLVERITVAAHSRRTIDLKAHPELASVAVSVIVESTNSVPVAVERVMWWPHAQWYDASVSAGVTGTGTKWAFAEGEQGGPFNSQTYIAIANTDLTAGGTANVTLIFEDGTSATRTVSLPAARRTTVDAGTFPEAENRRFGAIVESNGVPIAVERALYQSTGGLLWAGGGTSVATRMTP